MNAPQIKTYSIHPTSADIVQRFGLNSPTFIAAAHILFYRPKGSSQAQILEAKSNLLRMKQDIPLSEEEQAVVDDSLAALEKLCEQLADIPTPAGPTSRELGILRKLLLPMISLQEQKNAHL